MSRIESAFEEVSLSADPVALACLARELWGSVFFYRLPDRKGRAWYLLTTLDDVVVVSRNGAFRNETSLSTEELECFLGSAIDSARYAHPDAPFLGGILFAAGFEFPSVWDARSRSFRPPALHSAKERGDEPERPLAIFCAPLNFLLYSPSEETCLVASDDAHSPIMRLLAAAPSMAIADPAERAPADHRPGQSFPSDSYNARFAGARPYFLAGDVYQLITSDALEFECPGEDLFARYAGRLGRCYAEAPFAYMFSLRGTTVLGFCALPHLGVTEGTVTTDVFAGTLPATDSAEELERQKAEFRDDPGFLAEHLMLVDLERNELNQICDPATVTVEAPLSVRKVGSTTYLSSTVTGRLRADIPLWSVPLGAVPRGVVSGAPKGRAMEVIAELEAAPRGWYGGAVGVIDAATGTIRSNCIITCSVVEGSRRSSWRSARQPRTESRGAAGTHQVRA